MNLQDLVSPGRFVVETVVGPYVAEWRWIEALPAVVFIAPHTGEPAPAPQAPCSPPPEFPNEATEIVQ